MAVIKVFPGDVDKKLAEVFTLYGYDGASMEFLSRATGLKKASLYHRFPGGKKEMALHVLSNIETWFRENFDAVIQKTELPIDLRLQKALESISTLFSDGDRNCPLRMLSAGSESSTFQEPIARCFTIIKEGFMKIGTENGLSQKVAEAKATDAIIDIQGSLILSRAMNDNQIFRTSLAAIPELLGKQENKKE